MKKEIKRTNEKEMKGANDMKNLGNEIIKFEKENENKTITENKNQMSKYKYAKGFFIKYLRENGGKLKTYENKNDLHNGLDFTKNMIYLTGIELWHFANSLRFASALTIDSTNDGQVCVSITIPDTYKIGNKGEK